MNFTDFVAVFVIALIIFCAIAGFIDSLRNRKKIMKLEEIASEHTIAFAMVNQQFYLISKMMRNINNELF